ncbi:proton-conducting transporter transmembrane domain-containing protein, partial [Sphingomonas sp. CCH5-D11]|uniref:proton-conducting transporter transmembrane domain-containing protein n=1 Tax=Sphingomonas sp. CCH5-D11 TaxID=1768786 RepID=UPI0022B244C2
LARLWPVLSGSDWWFYLVGTTGLVTMVIGAAIALFKHDLKAILAYSTISQLGLMTMLFGFGTPAAALAGIFHLVNHSLFKAALFMNAGIVDHEAGTRDIRLLGGLARLMPITATLGIIAAASMAGLPPLGGFLSKEMMLEEAAHTGWAGTPWVVPLLALVGAALSVAYSLRFIAHLYLGPERDGYPGKPHDPPLGLWGPSASLVALTVLVGLFPSVLTGWLIAPAAADITGGTAPAFHPALWHGLTPALAMSVIAVALGALMLWRYGSLQRGWDGLWLPEAKRVFDGAVERMVQWARWLSDTIHNGSLQRQLALMFLLAVAIAAEAIWYGGYTPG